MLSDISELILTHPIKKAKVRSFVMLTCAIDCWHGHKLQVSSGLGKDVWIREEKGVGQSK